MKSTLLVFALLLCATLAFAVTWVSVGTVTNPNGTKRQDFVDLDKMVKQGPIRAVFVKSVNVPREIGKDKDKDKDKDIVYVDYVNVQQFNCDDHTDSVTKQSPEWRTGTQEVVIDHKDFTIIPPFHVDPGTVGEATMKLVCAR